MEILAWMKNGWLIPWSVAAICEMSKTSWQTGNALGKDDVENRSFKGPVFPFDSIVEYHPLSAKDQSRLRQFGEKVLPGILLGYALYAGRIWKGDFLNADLEEL